MLADKRKAKPSDREWLLDLTRLTYIKVNRKYLSPDTLDHYHLPWEWDSRNIDYIIIKKYIDEEFQDTLFEHTKQLRSRNEVKSFTEEAFRARLETKTSPRRKPTDRRAEPLSTERDCERENGRNNTYSGKTRGKKARKKAAKAAQQAKWFKSGDESEGDVGDVAGDGAGDGAGDDAGNGAGNGAGNRAGDGADGGEDGSNGAGSDGGGDDNKGGGADGDEENFSEEKGRSGSRSWSP